MPPADLRVCFLGDSLTAGVGDPSGAGWVGPVAAAAHAAGHALTAYHLGVRRDTTLDVARRWRQEAEVRLVDGDVHAVALAVGTNDVTLEGGCRRVARELSLEALGGMLDDARDRGWAALVVGPPPAADDGHHRRAADLAAGMAQVCRSHDVPFFDPGPALAHDPVWRGEVVAGDGHHPSTAGYARLAAVLEPVLLRWLAGLALTCSRHATRPEDQP